MNYIGNWSITELYNLPIGLRKWFVEKTLKQKEIDKEHIEKDYALNYLEFGLGDPKVADSKIELENSIHGFEKETGLKWPLR